MGGPAERELERAARLLAIPACGAISVGAGILALTVMPPDRFDSAALAVTGLALWRTVLIAGFLRRGPWPDAVLTSLFWGDVAVSSGCALAQNWIDVPYLVADGSGWVQSVVVVTAVGYPWIVSWRTALAGGAVLAACFGAGAGLTIGVTLSLVVLPSVWVLGNTCMSSLTSELVRRATRRADEATARRERAAADLEVAQARRAAEREHLAALHDTAAATLLMVGLGTVGDDDAWLAGQAARDLLVLAGSPPPAGSDDVLRLIRGVTATSGLDVGIQCTEAELILPAEVAAAFAGAVSEALRNVRLHAGVERAVVSLDRIGSVVRVEVLDSGRGLPAPGAIGAASRGIRHSIVGRLERAGGRAAVGSRESGGVRVRMEWADE